MGFYPDGSAVMGSPKLSIVASSYSGSVKLELARRQGPEEGQAFRIAPGGAGEQDLILRQGAGLGVLRDLGHLQQQALADGGPAADDGGQHVHAVWTAAAPRPP